MGVVALAKGYDGGSIGADDGKVKVWHDTGALLLLLLLRYVVIHVVVGGDISGGFSSGGELGFRPHEAEDW